LGSINNSKKIKTAYYCIECNNKLSFNFENFERIEISKIIDINNNEYSDIEDIKIQTELSQIFNPKGNFDKELVINRRILSFPGMRHSDLFTPRAYSILSDLFYQAHKIEDINIKNATLLFLTSGVAQCSRLIPFRNDLSTGGPAWTMPGFWLAPIHLETNPIIHLEARYKKFVKGLGALKKNYSKCNSITKIENIPTQQGLNSLEDDSIDGIFFDPPYGDNVPYIEFSAIWNLFIKNDIDYKNEIIVSDRKEFISSWDKYKEDIEKVISLFYQKLKTHGKILMTFNNLNPKAWKVILDAFGKYSFYCIDAKYQIPAVISSKAQMASNTSYIGDFYCVFEKTESRDFVNKDLYRITERAKQVLLSRNGKVPKNLINRVAVLTILNDNIDFNVLDNLNDALIPIAYEDKEYFYLRDELKDNNLLEKYNIEKRLKEISISSLKQGKKTIREFYEIILENTEDIGSPPLPEVRLLLSGIVLFDKQYCYLQNTDLTRQMALFENANQLESLTF
jgi:hypothetical protein